MCVFNKFAKYLNIFDKWKTDDESITSIDVKLTYIFIINFISIGGYYTYIYYNKSIYNYNNCNDTLRECSHQEILHVVFPYFGAMFGFYKTLIMIFFLLSYLLNFVTCSCCRKKSNKEVNVEINKVVSI